MKAVVVILSIIAFIACLLVGIQAGSGSFKLTDPTHPSGSTPIPPSQQRTLLVILADDIQNPSARLVGLWIVLYRPDTPHLMLVPLYPTDASDDLAAEFSLTSDRTPSASFLTAIHNYHFTWDGYILADITSVPALVDGKSQGKTGPGTPMNGNAAAASLRMPWEKRAEVLPSQISVGKDICDRLEAQTPDFNVKKFLTSIPSEHFRIEFNLDQLNLDWKGLAENKNPINCEFATP